MRHAQGLCVCVYMYVLVSHGPMHTATAVNLQMELILKLSSCLTWRFLQTSFHNHLMEKSASTTCGTLSRLGNIVCDLHNEEYSYSER